ncbi:hypothetical protein [Streptomyces pristinaespiralis]|uniref:hypothetical protein n=1 Tax=Streptomyces pristinaespiralis TaxID=38300 RepID=UPI0033E4F628
MAVASPAAAAGPSGCKSWRDSNDVRGYADCASGPGYVRVIVKCTDYRGVTGTYRGSWVSASSSAASVYSCGGQTAWVTGTSHETAISIG